MAIDKQYLTLEEVSIYLGVSYETVKDLIQSKKLAYLPLGKRKMVRITYLEKWCDKNTIKEKEAA